MIFGSIDLLSKVVMQIGSRSLSWAREAPYVHQTCIYSELSWNLLKFFVLLRNNRITKWATRFFGFHY